MSLDGRRFLAQVIIVIDLAILCYGEASASGVGTFETEPITKRPLPYALSATDLTYLALKEQEVYKALHNYASEARIRLRLVEK
jgi:hypothetical protein